MSTLLIKRAYRVLMLSMASVLIASMLAPIVAVASTELVAGDTAYVSNPEGAYLRTDTAVVDETTVSAELPQDTTVMVIDGPYYNDTGVWVYAAADGYGPGYISTSMLTKIETEEVADPLAAEVAPEEVVEEEPAAGLAWLEPIDSATVVDYNNALPVDGLAVRDGIDGNIIGYAPVGTWLDVTGAREWVGEASYVRVNFNGVGGYVHGDYIELSSEAVVEEPTEEVIWVEPTEVVTEVVPVETEVVTEVVPVETEVVTEEVPVETEVVTEVVPVETEVVTEEVPVETEVVTEVVPVETEVVTEEAPVETEVVTEVVPVETEVVTEEVPVETEVVTEEVQVEAEVATEETAAQAQVVTEEVASTPTEVVTEEAPVETEAPAEEVVTEEVAPEATVTEVATEAPTEAATEEATEVVTEEAATEEATVAPTQAATEAPTEEVAEPVSIASTADEFNADAMIGSATVTGTQNGLLCRVSPDPASAVLMTLSEGTKVLVSAEPVNGYLGIDCGGLQGFADVNYLWSGGAGDAEINAAKMNVVVTGTGNGLNCRTGAGLSNSIITTIFDGTTLVTRGAASNGWTPVICGGQNGFVSTTWIEPGAGSTGNTGSTATKGSATVNTGGDGLYCRTGAGTSYGVITVLSHGSSVAVRGAQQGEWVPVTCGGTAGFAHSAYLSVSSGSGTTAPGGTTGTATGNVTVANTGGDGLNCRTGAGTSNSVITVLALGQTVQTRSGSTNGWTAVICGGTNGFVSSQFVSGGQASPAPSSPAPAPSGIASGSHVKTTDALNLRYSASTTASISTVIPAGKVIQVTGALSNDYYPIDYDGLTGYVHSDYVVKTSEALSQRGGSATSPETSAPAPAPSTGSGSALVNYAMRYLGYPYVWATAGPASFDCSGFTYWVVKNVLGKDIGRGTWTQVAAGTPVSRSQLQPGDLVFHQNTYTAGLSHVSMYIGNNQMINALNEDAGVVIVDMTSPYWESRWYGAVRL